MTNFYNKGNYSTALEYALKMEVAAGDALGKDNAIYASSVNNVALMVRRTCLLAVNHVR